MMIDFVKNFYNNAVFAKKCKKVITAAAIAGIVLCALALFPPCNAFLVRTAERIKTITNPTWRSFIGSSCVFVMVFCAFILYNFIFQRIQDKLKIRILMASIAGILLVTTYINFMYGRQWLDSDMASEMILGNLLAKENKLVTSSWVYSTELRLVYQQLFYVPLFKLFSDWHLVRTITSLLNNILLLASYLFMMRQFSVSKKTALLTALFLLLPVSMQYWQIVLFGGYYVFFIAMFFCYLGLFAILLYSDRQNTSKKKKNIAAVSFVLLSLALGIGGIRGLLDIQVPLFITAMCVCFLGKTVNRKALCLSIAGLGLCAFGYLINTALHFFYHFLSHHGAFTIDLSDVFFQKLGNIIYNLMMFFGYTANARFMSVQGIINFCSIIFIFLMFYESVKVIRYKHINNIADVNISFALFFIVTIVYHVALFQILDEDPFSAHIIPSLTLYVPVVAVVFEYIKKTIAPLKARLLVSGMAFMILCAGTIKLYSLPEHDVTSYRKPSISYLEEHNLRFGFASFWNANIITELTNGKIEMLGLEPKNIHIFNWLRPTAYENPDYHKGETFLLLTKDEAETYNKEPLLQGLPDYADDDFVVWIFPSASTIFNGLITENK
jgi:hypothetical protein